MLVNRAGRTVPVRRPPDDALNVEILMTRSLRTSVLSLLVLAGVSCRRDAGEPDAAGAGGLRIVSLKKCEK